MRKNLFQNFSEYWYYVRNLSKKQRKFIFESLSKPQQNSLTKSYSQGSWDEVFIRNNINKILDEAKQEYGYDLLGIKCKAISGKSTYVPLAFWDFIVDKTRDLKIEHVQFIFSGIIALPCEKNPDVILITSQKDVLD